MKTFSQYLSESTKTYVFKLKIAGELESNLEEEIKSALQKFSVVSISKGRRGPIQDAQLDFPNIPCSRVTSWDVGIKYPTTPNVLEEYLARSLSMSQNYIRVTHVNEPLAEFCSATEKPSGDSVLLKPELEGECAQDMVSTKRMTGLIKELIATKRTTGEQYTGVNDNLLAASIPTESLNKQDEVSASKSPVGSTYVKKPDLRKGQ